GIHHSQWLQHIVLTALVCMCQTDQTHYIILILTCQWNPIYQSPHKESQSLSVYQDQTDQNSYASVVMYRLLILRNPRFYDYTRPPYAWQYLPYTCWMNGLKLHNHLPLQEM